MIYAPNKACKYSPSGLVKGKEVDNMEKAMELAVRTQCRAHAWLKNERGDTNFISVLILLGIAIALAAIFLGYKESVLAWVKENIGSFFS